MSLYTIGDLHLSFSCDKPMDVFKGWDNYVEKLTENWNGKVTDDDTVVIIGDISWAMNLSEAVDDFSYINNRLNGNKIIIKGNHDYWWNTASKMNSFLCDNGFNKIKILNNNAYLCEGVSVIGSRGWINDTGEESDRKVLAREAGRLELSVTDGIKHGGELIAFIHYPPIFSTEENYYILEVLHKYGIKKCFYGHIHGAGSKNAFIGKRDDVDYHLVSADYVEFSPVLVKE